MQKLSPIKKLQFEVFNFYKKIQKDLKELNYLFWECTLRCNLSCLHCGSDCLVDNKINDMPLKDFLGVLDKVKEEYDPHKTTIVLSGGEPLMRNDLEICGKEIHNREFPWGMVTNGFGMTEKRYVALLDSGLRSITVSLDGLEENHNWLRNNKNSFKKAVETLGYIVNTKNIAYDVVTCVNKKNINELEKLKDFLIKIGVKAWRLFTIFPKGRAKYYDELKLTDEQHKYMLNFIIKTRKEKQIKLNYDCEAFLGNYEGKARDYYFFCRAGISVGSVLANGDISACPALRGDYIQGNIYKDDFIDVWKNRFQIMRDRSWAKSGICKDCENFKYCEGNGLHLRDEATKELSLCHWNIFKN
ncbi:MAG TPA: TIGR04133 family radical SAM/SPASM protein [Spirochaetota bacterium]|nr:TIGR04133 family radical SAM/SPASM protein [Spirochaetota bacterium]